MKLSIPMTLSGLLLATAVRVTAPPVGRTDAARTPVPRLWIGDRTGGSDTDSTIVLLTPQAMQRYFKVRQALTTFWLAHPPIGGMHAHDVYLPGDSNKTSIYMIYTGPSANKIALPMVNYGAIGAREPAVPAIFHKYGVTPLEFERLVLSVSVGLAMAYNDDASRQPVVRAWFEGLVRDSTSVVARNYRYIKLHEPETVRAICGVIPPSDSAAVSNKPDCYYNYKHAIDGDYP